MNNKIVKNYTFKAVAKRSWNIEKNILKEFSAFKYVPNIKFRGYTECFNLEKDYLHRLVWFLDEERA